jgi:hypothetical protein
MNAINTEGIHGMARKSQLVNQDEGLEKQSFSKRAYWVATL